MDDSPNKVIRFIQLGMYNRAFESKTIWLCAGCQTCSGRCPKNFEPAKLMDALRQIAIEDNIKPGDKKIQQFHKAFINQIKNSGRSFELGLIRDYKISTMNIFQDLDIAPQTFMKGKIAITPHKIKERAKIKKMINKTLKGEGK